MKPIYRYILPVLLASCASSTDIMPIGEDTYIVVREESIYFPSLDTPKEEALRAATRHCKLQLRKISISNINESKPPYTGENPQRAEVQFKCLETGAPASYPSW